MVRSITSKQIKVKNKEPPDKYIYKLNDFHRGPFFEYGRRIYSYF